MDKMTKGIIAVVVSFILSGLLAFSGFRLHLTLARGDHLWWLGIIQLCLISPYMVIIHGGEK